MVCFFVLSSMHTYGMHKPYISYVTLLSLEGEGLASLGTTHWYRVSLVNLELSWFVFVTMHTSRQEVQKHPQEFKVHPSHI